MDMYQVYKWMDGWVDILSDLHHRALSHLTPPRLSFAAPGFSSYAFRIFYQSHPGEAPAIIDSNMSLYFRVIVHPYEACKFFFQAPQHRLTHPAAAIRQL